MRLLHRRQKPDATTEGGDAASTGLDGPKPGADQPARSDQPAASQRDATNREPDHPAKPEKPTDLHKQSWAYVGRKTIREFGEDQCTDLAAALTYYAVLAIFPATLALLSLLGVVGQGQKSLNTVLDVLRPMVSPSTLTSVKPTLEHLANSGGAGITLVVGILGALWSASGYVGAFSRAMNRIYEVAEGRPFWKLRPTMLIVTALSILLSAVALLILVVSGPVAKSIGNVIGLGSTAVTVWGIAKWPVLALVVVLVVALLYYATPNVKQPKFRWVSPGAFLAILVWLLASVGFAFYVANFSSYNRTYGAVAGVVVALLWLWITNLALLFGAELDAELERARQLQLGLPAEEEIQLPVRDDRGIRKSRAKHEKEVARARAIRESAHDHGDPTDRPFRRG
ncbi:MAG: YihY/virulence factor BrkB family protein [Actinomycetota bacterium]|nr:YihY/virulence factor BrkB family protein [Actinomycetota bacterium]